MDKATWDNLSTGEKCRELSHMGWEEIVGTLISHMGNIEADKALTNMAETVGIVDE